MIQVRRLSRQPGVESGSRIITHNLNKRKLMNFLLGVMEENGIPLSLLATYQELTLKKWDNTVAEYATAFDISSPEYRKGADKYNENILAIRRGMESTETGRKMIARMKEEGVDDGTTVPYPRFTEAVLI